eukprot:jgi/Galph1/2236/GphlegSOOS_G902.1
MAWHFSKGLPWLFLVVILQQTYVQYCKRKRQIKPLHFAVITDVQYSDKDSKTVLGMERRYREALGKLQQAVQQVNQQQQEELYGLFHLGDLIDGSIEGEEQTKLEYYKVVNTFRQARVPVYHVIGNHCLEIDRDELLDMFPKESFYYYLEPNSEWCFIILDCLEVSLKRAPDTKERQEAEVYWSKLQSQPNGVPWNGAISSSQLEWLQHRLQRCKQQHRKVIIFGHIPLLPQAADEAHILWNAPQVLDLLNAYASVVVAYFAGHYHKGGYYYDSSGIHHMTFPAICDAPTNSNAMAIITCDKDVLRIEGYGIVPSRELSLSTLSSVSNIH